MNETRYSLCPACDACPEVVIAEDSVVIGEAGNQVRLSTEEWNVLVAGVKNGKLGSADGKAESRAICACGCECCA